jgi:hypothetical protein
VFTYDEYKGIIPLSSVLKTRYGIVGRTLTSAEDRYTGITCVQIAVIMETIKKTKTTNKRTVCHFILTPPMNLVIAYSTLL